MSTQKPSPETSRPVKKSPKTPLDQKEREIGGFADQNLPEPTRFGDWEVKGRCSDF